MHPQRLLVKGRGNKTLHSGRKLCVHSKKPSPWVRPNPGAALTSPPPPQLLNLLGINKVGTAPGPFLPARSLRTRWGCPPLTIRQSDTGYKYIFGFGGGQVELVNNAFRIRFGKKIRSSLLLQRKEAEVRAGWEVEDKTATSWFPHDDLLEADWLQGPVRDNWQDGGAESRAIRPPCDVRGFDNIKNV